MRKGLVLAGALISAASWGCVGQDREPPVAEAEGAGQELLRSGQYAIADGVLYRVRAGELEALAVLPGGGLAPDTLERCSAEIPDLARGRFKRLRLAPDGGWAAWETAGPGACVGVVGPGHRGVRVLGRWSAAIPDSVLWAPAGRYLAVWLAHPGPRRSLTVYDAAEGERLEMPWEQDCAYVEDCDVERVAWLGGTLLNVGIRLGPAEESVDFEVNVSASPAVEVEEEM